MPVAPQLLSLPVAARPRSQSPQSTDARRRCKRSPSRFPASARFAEPLREVRPPARPPEYPTRFPPKVHFIAKNEIFEAGRLRIWYWLIRPVSNPPPVVSQFEKYPACRASQIPKSKTAVRNIGPQKKIRLTRTRQRPDIATSRFSQRFMRVSGSVSVWRF